jgi:predicted RNA-binding Zn-ribbon protein involved in translation (DUF1610 family)
MRAASVFTTTCDCGADLESTTPQVKCPRCGVLIHMEWGVVTEIADGTK